MSLRTSSVGTICLLLLATAQLGCSNGDPGGDGFADTASANTDPGTDPTTDPGADAGDATTDSSASLPTVEIEQPEDDSFYNGKLSFVARIAPFGRLDLMRQVQIDGVSRPDTYSNDISFELDTTNPAHWAFLHDPQPSQPLADGQHSFSVWVTPAGAEPVSETVHFNVDNTGPVVVWDSPPDCAVAEEEVYVMLSFFDQGSGLGRFVVGLDGNQIIAPTSLEGSPGAVRDLTVPVGGAQMLAPGQHVIDVEVSDVLGNTTTSSRCFLIEEYPSYVEPETYQLPGSSSVNDALLRRTDSDACHDLVLATDEAVFFFQGMADDPGRCVGRFGQPAAVTEGGYTAIALEDRVGPGGAPDGVPDLIGVQGAAGESVLRVQMGTVDPALGFTFAAPLPVEQTISARAVDLSLGDFDGDGISDAIVTNEDQAFSIALLAGTADGAFAEPLRFEGVVGARRALIADLSDDGALDVAVATKGGLAMLRGKAGGQFEAPETIDATLGSLADIDIHDVNGDMRPDIVGLDEANEELVFLLSTPAGFLGNSITVRTLSRPGKLPSGGLVAGDTTHPNCPHVHVFSRDLRAFARHLHSGCL